MVPCLMAPESASRSLHIGLFRQQLGERIAHKLRPVPLRGRELIVARQSEPALVANPAAWAFPCFRHRCRIKSCLLVSREEAPPLPLRALAPAKFRTRRGGGRTPISRRSAPYGPTPHVARRDDELGIFSSGRPVAIWKGNSTPPRWSSPARSGTWPSWRTRSNRVLS
jgi:hypothetical protein